MPLVFPRISGILSAMQEQTPVDPAAFFINLCVAGELVPLTQGELLQFFHVHYAAINQIPADLPEVRDLLRRGQQFYEQDQSPQNEAARQCNREKCGQIPPAGAESMPDFLYLNPIEINGVPQTGLFTTQALPIGAWIGAYTGMLFPGNHPTRSLYAILIDDREAGVALQVDAQNYGNHTRFMNHADAPNVKPAYLFHQGMYYVVMTTIREVEAHQQLTFNYSRQYWDKLGVAPAAL